MKTGILLFEQFLGKKDVGSSRIRGHWIVRNWQKAGADLGEIETFKFGAKYDAVIFQKAYFVEFAKAFDGVKILDICDPDWLDWSYRFKEMIEEVDAVTCSSLALTKAISKFTQKPVYFIPDRVDTENFPAPKEHVGPTKAVAWFGYSQNFPILDSCLKALMKHGLDLIVISDGVYVPPAAFKEVKVQNFPFNEQHYMDDIQKADLVLNPVYSKGKWKYKSTNKTSIAQALGMPVAQTGEELDALMTEEARKKAAEQGLQNVRDHFDISLSVIDYKDVIQEVLNTKTK